MGITPSFSFSCPTQKNQKEFPRILILGCQGVGKTRLFTSLRDFELRRNPCPVYYTPTVGFNKTTISSYYWKNTEIQIFTLLDVGGQTAIRKYWNSYYVNIKYVIFILSTKSIFSNIEEQLNTLYELYDIHPELHIIVIENIYTNQQPSNQIQNKCMEIPSRHAIIPHKVNVYTLEGMQHVFNIFL